MSAQNNINPEAAVDPNALIDELTGQKPPAAAQEPQKIKIPVFGQEIPIDDPVAFGKQLEQVMIQAKQAQQAPQGKPIGGQVTGDEPETFNKEKFANMFVENTVEALNYGLKFTPINKQLAQMQQTLAAQNQQLAIWQFLDQNKDFPTKDQQAWAAMDQVIKANNLPVNPQSLNLAYAYARNNGFIKTPEPQHQAAQEITEPAPYTVEQYGAPAPQPNVRQMPQRPAGLPSVPRGGNNFDANLLDRAQNLSTAQLKELITRMQGGA